MKRMLVGLSMAGVFGLAVFSGSAVAAVSVEVMCPAPSAIHEQPSPYPRRPGKFLASGKIEVKSPVTSPNFKVSNTTDSQHFDHLIFSTYNYDGDDGNLDCDYKTERGDEILYGVGLNKLYHHCHYLNDINVCEGDRKVCRLFCEVG